MTQRYLSERLTYDQLFRMSDPKRTIRSFKVKGPPLEIDSYQDAVYYAFNFKSNPSTTGLRHRGYIKFLRPRIGGQKPLQHLNCIVDCTCPDFRYRWAWANKQRGASRVGPQSLNQSLNRAPRRTNPTSKPGLCKHVLAAREYIYGLLSSFPSNEPDTADKLNKLTQFATKRWTNMDAEMDAARDVQARIAAARNLRNAGQPAPQDIPIDQEEPGEEPREPGDEEAYINLVPPEIEDAPELEQLPPPPTSFATNVRPPSQRGRTLPAASAQDRIRKGTPQRPASKIADRAQKAGFNSPAAYNFARRQGLGDSLGYAAVKNETNDVVMTNGQKDMNALTEAQRIISELEQDQLAALRAAGQEDDQENPEALPPSGDMGGGDEFNDGGAEIPPQGGDMGAGDMGGDLPPSEPPMSDSAVGADSEGQVALMLLREIRDFCGQLASALAPAPEPEAGAAGDVEGGGDFGGEPEDGEEIPVEDPSAEAEAESEGDGEGEGEVEREEEEEEETEPAND